MEPVFVFFRLVAPWCVDVREKDQVTGVDMKLYAPNIALFVIAGCLAMLGVLAAFPIALPIPGLTGNSAWYIFLAWFLLAAGSAIPHPEEPDQE
jgi:hypothetical protein